MLCKCHFLLVFTFKNPDDDPFYQKLLALTAASSGNVAAAAANKRIKIESDSAAAADDLTLTPHPLEILHLPPRYLGSEI